MDIRLQQAQQKIFDGGQLDRREALGLLDADPQALYQAADEVRRHCMGTYFDLCSIINARSGNCTENCRFCAQSARHHTGVSSYAVIPEEEALAIARDNDRHGVYRISLVTSGHHLSGETLATLASLYRKIKEETSLRLCASCGFLDEQTIAALKEAGVERYHCNLEASRNFFPQVCTSHTWEEKVETLRLARAGGLSLCSGGIIGMGEGVEDRIDMALELRGIGVHSIPVNILTPIAGTPLADLSPLALDEILTCIALFRFINPQAIIRMCGGRQQLGEDQYRCFSSGANGAIAGNYLTTSGNSMAEDLRRIAAMGFTFARDMEHAA